MGLDRVTDAEIVEKFGIFLRTPPHAWPIISKSDTEIQYKVMGFSLFLCFMDGWKYHVEISRDGRTIEEYGEVPYSGDNVPNVEKIFRENMDFARRELADGK